MAGGRSFRLNGWKSWVALGESSLFPEKQRCCTRPAIDFVDIPYNYPDVLDRFRRPNFTKKQPRPLRTQFQYKQLKHEKPSKIASAA